MVEDTPAQPNTPPPVPPPMATPRPRLDGWRLGRLLLTLGGVLALLAVYAPWQRVTYFDRLAPGNQQTQDLAYTTILTSVVHPGEFFFRVTARGSLFGELTPALINTILPLLGPLLALLLWVRLPRWLSRAALIVSALTLVAVGVVAVEYLRATLAIQDNALQAFADSTRIGHLRILQGPFYLQHSTALAWGYYLLLGAILTWVAGLILIVIAPRRRRMRPDAPATGDDPRRPSMRDRRLVVALLTLGVVLWVLGTNYLPWVAFRCPSERTSATHYICDSGKSLGAEVYVLLAHYPIPLPNLAARLISPSPVDVAYTVVFGSLLPFTFILLAGIGAAAYVAAHSPSRRGMWGYWTYFGFVALVTAIVFARTRTMYADITNGADSLGLGVLVTIIGFLLIGAAILLLQRAGAAQREGSPPD